MFSPLAIKEINLFILKKNLKRVSDILYDLKIMEFINLEKEGFDNFEIERQGDLVSELLQLRSAISILKDFHTRDTLKTSKDAINETLCLKNNINTLEKEILKIQDDMKRLSILKSLKIKDSELSNSNIAVGFVPTSKSRLLKKLEKNKIFRKYKEDERIYFIANKKDIDFTYKDFYLPKENNINLKTNLNEKLDDLKESKFKLEKIANNNLRHLQTQELKLSKIISSNEARSNFAQTDNIVILNGFIPKKDALKLKKSLEREIADSYEIEIFDPKTEAPIKLEHKGIAKSFENLLRIYSLPKYGEFDPTLLMLLVFPIFYGFILGDVIYGLISLIVFSIAKIKFKNLRAFISILQLSAISSIIFGFIFGEFLGFEPYHPLIERAHDPTSLLVIALIFGIIHVNLGLIIGFFNLLPNIKKAIYDKISWIILQVGGFLLYLGSSSNELFFTITGGILLVLSIILIYLGHGMLGIIELPSIFTNILSYARLMAVGLSSVVIAILINTFSLSLFSSGFFGIIAGVILFTIGHIFNICLGSFEGFLHSLRLHYVEFFTKFYSGGGREFKAFGDRIHED
jgi:V/A-type H+-transporting ATPase subunit I